MFARLNYMKKFLLGLLSILLLSLLFSFIYFLFTASSIAGCGCLNVTDGAKMVAAAPNNFNFPKASATPFIPAKTENALGDVATYLKENKGKTLTLTGDYDEAENHNNGKLGLDRAGSIKNYLVGLGVPAAQIALDKNMISDYSFPREKIWGHVDFDFKDGVVAATPAPKPAAPSTELRIVDSTGDPLNINYKENIAFKRNQYQVLKPLNGKVETAYKQTAAHLKKFPNKSIVLTGLYEKGETNTSSLTNLGVARANSVKNELVRLGASRKQIETKGRQIAKLPMLGGNINGGMEYVFKNRAADAKPDTRLAAIEKDWSVNPLVVYFKTNSDELIMNKKERQRLEDLIYYLDRKDNKSVVVEGHTDSRGSAQANQNLSQRRAKFIKDYLTGNGVNNKQMKAAGKGESRPIDKAENEKAWAKNRRVEVRLNK